MSCVRAEPCTRESWEITLGIYGRSGCGEANAFFHALTSCCIAKAITIEFAIDIGKALEVATFNLDGWDGCTDTLNDIHNNARGALLGNLGGNCQFLVQDALTNGQLIVTPDADHNNCP